MLAAATILPGDAAAQRHATTAINVGVLVADCAVIAGTDTTQSGNRSACALGVQARPEVQHCPEGSVTDCRAANDTVPAIKNVFDQLYF